VLTRPGVVRAAPTLPGTTRIRLPPAPPPCCDRTAAKVSHLHSNLSASRRTHDLRHGAASLAHEAGADLKTLQDLLGHSSIVVTADTYTSVLPASQRRCADATAALVLAADRHTRRRIKAKAAKNRPTAHGEKQMTPPTRLRKPARKRRSRAHHRTHRHAR
jgi:hypothetical protein